MKKLLVFSISCVVSLAVLAQGGQFTLKGKIDDVKEPAKVMLQYSKAGARFIDTTELLNGNFTFKGEIDKPMRGVLYLLKSSDNPRMMMAMNHAGEIVGRDGISIYLDKGSILVEGSTIKTSVVKGSEAHRQFMALQKILQPFNDKKEAISQKLAALTPEQRKGPENDALVSELNAVSAEMAPAQKAFIMSNLDSYVSWDIVSGKSIISNPAEQKEMLFSFGEKFLNSKEGLEAQNRLKIAFTTALGQVAPDFTQNDTNDKAISLSSLKGKYVLVDFWASWCGPCRAENPNVKRAYDKFKHKNFEILAVSLDNKKEAWLKAIADDDLPWLHVSDLKGWENEVAALYNVRAVPQNWLIDPEGKIIAVNMRGAELDKKLSELIK